MSRRRATSGRPVYFMLFTPALTMRGVGDYSKRLWGTHMGGGRFVEVTLRIMHSIVSGREPYWVAAVHCGFGQKYRRGHLAGLISWAGARSPCGAARLVEGSLFSRLMSAQLWWRQMAPAAGDSDSSSRGVSDLSKRCSVPALIFVEKLEHWFLFIRSLGGLGDELRMRSAGFYGGMIVLLIRWVGVAEGCRKFQRTGVFDTLVYPLRPVFARHFGGRWARLCLPLVPKSQGLDPMRLERCRRGYDGTVGDISLALADVSCLSGHFARGSSFDGVIACFLRQCA